LARAHGLGFGLGGVITSKRGVRWPMLSVFTALTVLVSSACKPTSVQPMPIREAPRQVEARTPPLGRTDLEALGGSVHQKLECSSCHPGARPNSTSSDPTLSHAVCTPCHADALRRVGQSVHARGATDPDLLDRCIACHGAHDIVSRATQWSSPLGDGWKQACGPCHQNPGVGHEFGVSGAASSGKMWDAIHAKATIDKGLVVVPSCADCHGSIHAISSSSRLSPKERQDRIKDACAHCHRVAAERYSTSSHYLGKARGKILLPSCADCHAPHSVPKGTGSDLILASDRVCGRCHQDRLKEYRSTYHGQAQQLGTEAVAACFDCHGKHAILPVSNPASRLSSQNRLSTCRKCHAGAPQGLVSYAAHPDSSDVRHYPLFHYARRAMDAVLLAVLGVFLVHALMWSLRLMVDFGCNPRAFVLWRRQLADERSSPSYRRFSAVDRFAHGLLMICFLLLVATGMPLKFHDAPWARSLLDHLGGASVASGLHRVGAVGTLLAVVVHLVAIVRTVLAQMRHDPVSAASRPSLGKILFGPDSPLPRWHDVSDIAAHIRWFFGKGPKPAFERFAYWEKMDYLAVLTALAVLGLSGLVLWIPLIATRWLPGWTINVAQLAHGDEGLLVAAVIFVIHFWHVHFRPDRFPLDSVMFSGKISEARMREERARQYTRLVSQGRLNDLLVTNEWREWKPVAFSLGLVALTVGLGLAVAIFWAMARFAYKLVMGL